jgi:hypothetical protein
MPTYSFQDIAATLVGPGGAVSLGNGAGTAEEGITIEMFEDKNNMVLGADGTVMHSLHAGKGANVSIRLLKTSPTNAIVEQLYNFQTASAATHGQSTMTISDLARGDITTLRNVAFRRKANLTYAKDGGVNEWQFHAGYVDTVLGNLA